MNQIKIGDKLWYKKEQVTAIAIPDSTDRVPVKRADGTFSLVRVSQLSTGKVSGLSAWWNGENFYIRKESDSGMSYKILSLTKDEIAKIKSVMYSRKATHRAALEPENKPEIVHDRDGNEFLVEPAGKPNKFRILGCDSGLWGFHNFTEGLGEPVDAGHDPQWLGYYEAVQFGPDLVLHVAGETTAPSIEKIREAFSTLSLAEHEYESDEL